LATCFLGSELEWYRYPAGAALGFGLFYGMAWLYARIAGRQGLGGGDIKLLAMLGSFLGPGGVFATIMISSIAGSLVGVGWGLAARRRNLMTFAIPYGPFLVIGGLYYYFFSEYLWLRFTIPT
jgi:leader peptidase (prepilin peptidase)/N-methyltransferase